ncbi:MAG TPA: tetratricopeptide repeat protein [Candidatus Acidoferrales bacterium]|nr:tetratricopeptide repeat protein [Candidatus Acidoferrales bacterium]
MILLLLALCLGPGARAAATGQANRPGGSALSGGQSSNQQTPTEAARLSAAKQLYEQGRWSELLLATAASPAGAADLDFYRGMALAKLGRWSEARAALESGEKKAPGDKRFPTELAGIEYRLKNYDAAKANLGRAVRLDPRDAYALNFLGTIYLLRGNLEAALATWNRAGLPEIHGIETEPESRVRAGLLERAFTFSRLSTLTLGEFQTTEARLDGLGVFSLERWELRPSGNDSFDAVFHAAERDGWGANKWVAALSMLRGLPYETIYPTYWNARGEAMNFEGLVRWDAQKRRAWGSVSMPIEGDPRWRLVAYADARDENWDLQGAFGSAAAPLSDLKLRRVEAGASVESIESGRWTWTAGAAFTRRLFGNFSGASAAAASFFTGGNSLEYRAGSSYTFLSIPQRRLTGTASGSAAAGRMFAGSLGAYGRTQESAELDWLPREQGDDYEMRVRIRAGQTFGRVPFDELFTLGVERDDNDLWLRGIPATHDGRKGNAPKGRNYVLWNWEDDKIVHQGAFFEVRIGPFLDAGRISDPSGVFGSRGWLWDPGVQLKIRVLDAVSVALSYGHDMRSGQNTFFGATGR